MSSNTHVRQTVKVDSAGGGSDGQQPVATVRLSIDGAVTMLSKDYAWTGVETADMAQQVAFLARWDLGRALNAATREPPAGISGVANRDGWETVVTWSPRNLPTITVTLDGFASLHDAHSQALDVVKAVVASLVPPNNSEERRERLNAVYLPNTEQWPEGLYRMTGIYP